MKSPSLPLFVFEFGSKKFFFFDDRLTETDDFGRYELAAESMLSLQKALGREADEKTAKKMMLAFLLDHEVKEIVTEKVHLFDYEVKKFGNGGHVIVDKDLVGRRVRVKIEVLDGQDAGQKKP